MQTRHSHGASFHPGDVASCVTGEATGAIDVDGCDAWGGVFGGVVDEGVEGGGVMGECRDCDGDNVEERSGEWTGGCGGDCGGRGELVGEGVTDGSGE